MTYLPPSVVPLPIYLSFLATAYKACQKVPTATELPGAEPDFRHGLDLFTKTERTTELCRTSVSSSRLDLAVPACLLVAPEPILGPTLVIRIVLHIISEGLVESLSAISQWTDLPAGTPSDTALVQVRQITSLSVLGKIVRPVVTRRLRERRERGHRRSPNEEDFAVSASISSAGLGVAIRALDQVVRDEERKVWEKEAKIISREISMCLGDAADSWAELDEWKLSKWASQKAMECLNGIDETQAKREGWNVVKMKQKNQDRLEKAHYVLRLIR